MKRCDDDARNADIISKPLQRHTDVIGVYNAGAGNAQLPMRYGPQRSIFRLLWIARALTAHAQSWLMSGVAAGIINHDAGHEARSAARILMAHGENVLILDDRARIRIEIFQRNNMP